jgi:hypothetical protein
MRKWYGQSDGEGGDGYDDYDIDYDDEEEEEQGEDERPTVLVMDADSEVGTLVVLQLILQRRRVRIVCKDASAVKAAYGDYVQPVEADCNDAASLGAALRGAKMVICSGQVCTLQRSRGLLGAVGRWVRMHWDTSRLHALSLSHSHDQPGCGRWAH